MDTTSAMEPGPAVGELVSVPGPSPEQVAQVKAEGVGRVQYLDKSTLKLRADEPTVIEG